MLSLEEIKKKLMSAEICDGEITGIELVEEGPMEFIPGLSLGIIPSHLKVHIVCKPEAESNIRIEVRFPIENWNGDFLGTGNGGSAGILLPFVMAGPLALGFAVANTDMGTSAGKDCGIGNKAVWRDFGYRATHLMTVNGKKVTEIFYGKSIRYSYFTGASTGGQQALMEAQRYPEDYDGILASAPAHDRINLHVGFVWEWLALNQTEESRFTKEEAQKVVQIILDKYGEEDERHPGDNFLYRPDKIHIDKAIFRDSGLRDEQIDALMKIYRGARNPKNGEKIHNPIILPGTEDFGLPNRCNREEFAQGFFYLFRWIFGADFDFTKFDFDVDTKRAHEELDHYLNATEANLSEFRNRGGKLLMIHGTADPMIPCTTSIQYYEQVKERMGDVSSFFRLYLAPGMGHVSGGPGVQDIVFGLPATPKDEKHLGLLALKEWVENDIEPECLLPVAFRDGNELNGYLDSTYAYERPMYPYSEQSHSIN